MSRERANIRRIEAGAYTIPTDAPGGDGTRLWNKTTLVTAHVYAGDKIGFGYTYADASTAHFIQEQLAQVLIGCDAMAIASDWTRMNDAVRDLGGHRGLSQMAISAVDAALWDLKARLLEISLVDLFGAARPGAPVYGSGGYVTYTREQLQSQLAGWVESGIPRVKMKIGRHPQQDIERVRWAREAIGPDAQLMVDANGAYACKQALGFCEAFKELGVVWFEEPVPSDAGSELALLRRAAPAPIEIAAGEYGDGLSYFRRMLEAEAVDVLQADASRCGGYTAFLGVDSLCRSHHIPLSSHCAPTLHASVACAAPALRHVEYFHDHARIEEMLMDGFLAPGKDGSIVPERALPGNGLVFKHADAQKYSVI